MEIEKKSHLSLELEFKQKRISARGFQEGLSRIKNGKINKGASVGFKFEDYSESVINEATATNDSYVIKAQKIDRVTVILRFFRRLIQGIDRPNIELIRPNFLLVVDRNKSVFQITNFNNFGVFSVGRCLLFKPLKRVLGHPMGEKTLIYDKRSRKIILGFVKNRRIKDFFVELVEKSISPPKDFRINFMKMKKIVKTSLGRQPEKWLFGHKLCLFLGDKNKIRILNCQNMKLESSFDFIDDTLDLKHATGDNTKLLHPSNPELLLFKGNNNIIRVFTISKKLPLASIIHSHPLKSTSDIVNHITTSSNKNQKITLLILNN